MSSATNNIGVIVCSQRTPRAGLQISTFVLDTLQAFQKTHPSPTTPYKLSLIDLKDHPLPMYDEPGIPSRIFSSSEYQHAHTRAWSEYISTFQAFVFVTPQYNWGYPASIKNAIDYLFNEWKEKPAMVVSYGGHGGGKAATQLQQVLHGLGMKVVEETVGLMFPDRSFLVEAATGKDLGLKVVPVEGGKGGQVDVIDKENAIETLAENGGTGVGEGENKDESLWAKESKQMCAAFSELVTRLDS